jgi:hypothetical protein
MTHLMSSKSDHAEKKGPQPRTKSASKKLYHAMRNGTLYRSGDGVNWEIETDPDVAPLREGASRVSSPAKGRAKKNN